MKKRIWALLLALAMLCCLFAGCGKTETPAEAPAESSAETPAEAPAEEAPAEETPAEEPAEEPAEAPEDAPAFDDSTVTGSSAVETEAVEAAVTISYPIGDGENDSVSLWYSFTSFVFGEFFNSVEEFPCMPYMQEQTGVRLEATEVSDSAATEQYQLMIASGDWCDLIPTNLYTGGAAQAFADDVTLDLGPYLEESAPDFWAQANQYTEAEIYAGTTDGVWLSLPAINKSWVNDQGCFTRGDWLKALDLEVPTKQDEFMNMVYAMYEAYHPTHALVNVGPTCSFEFGNSWFDVAIYSVQGTTIAPYMKDGTVESGLNQDNYRAYLEWMHQLYVDGIINQDFYAKSQVPGETNGIIGSGNAVYWGEMADHMYDIYSYVQDPAFELQLLPIPLNNEGFRYSSPRMPMSSATGGGGGAGAGIGVTTTAEDPEFVLNWLNWFYTEDGYMFANYGIPGECWEYDENGNVKYTDTMLNNPLGMNSQLAFTTYGWSITSSLSFGTRFMDTYDQSIKDAITMWSDTTNVRYDQTVPTGAALDADESNSIVAQVADITAYADEMVLKFILGDETLDDATWAEFTTHLDELGLSDCVKVYQKAYADYDELFGE